MDWMEVVDDEETLLRDCTAKLALVPSHPGIEICKPQAEKDKMKGKGSILQHLSRDRHVRPGNSIAQKARD